MELFKKNTSARRMKKRALSVWKTSDIRREFLFYHRAGFRRLSPTKPRIKLMYSKGRSGLAKSPILADTKVRKGSYGTDSVEV
jgi:hypothetical protein